MFRRCSLGFPLIASVVGWNSALNLLLRSCMWSSAKALPAPLPAGGKGGDVTTPQSSSWEGIWGAGKKWSKVCLFTIWRSGLQKGLDSFLGFFFAWFGHGWIKEEQCQECGKFGNELLSLEEASQVLSKSRESLPGLSPKRFEIKRTKAISVHRWNELAAWQRAQVRDGIRTLLQSICNKWNV